VIQNRSMPPASVIPVLADEDVNADVDPASWGAISIDLD
jgi:hypothetical protein